jgi:hypothetical protein
MPGAPEFGGKAVAVGRAVTLTVIVGKARARDVGEWHNPDVLPRSSQIVINRLPRISLATAGIVLLLGCELVGGGGEAAAPAKPLPPPLTPAITETGAKRALARHMLTMNLAQKRLSVTVAAKAETGSALEMRKAQYKIFKANKLRAYIYKFSSAVGASPKFNSHPRWFMAAATDIGGGEKTRDLMVFVQDKQGGAWRAAYSPSATRVTGALGHGIDVPDVADVVRTDDTTLVLPPGRLAAASADMLSKGKRSPSTRLFQLNGLVSERYKSVLDNREVYTKMGWKGYYTPVASPHPVYAVRTTSGGALVWYAVDFKTAGRNPGKATELTWEVDSWGDLFAPFIGRSEIRSWYTGLERQELVAYVPPQGKGKIRIIAGRWAPLALRGR